ncbi:MAG: hypothetical protein UV48_C0015G0030 [Candidatus Azambacteria bacterium GW2011_GWA2_42_9]|uniref:Uncharacterized protein n=3 Tax=Candidatus Azamiibacteriota TaxID=1752741 RepID=A0A0G0ZA19_9BACT|nr:MAG: hypothetical protein UV07_C0017G0007 [Candidatus Azambacteria bacterium GW2011_GWB1_42_17]KKS45550.1 MAG: hypothetical protein UV10_C0020G0007 [Candidatus Azambacteria bacterium GW2011_GWA1_42_19]KKS75272.1 MAG: hypothetical protein UV48_C0015G0030 [Candidatus Azambacteria bacterium GW2011_GWA2_42_9]KKS87788.1 MAG: hypothetical protein UV62_C0026G0012 [Parcubacteria group bacterium GW2011_GWC1_43_11]
MKRLIKGFAILSVWFVGVGTYAIANSSYAPLTPLFIITIATITTLIICLE